MSVSFCLPHPVAVSAFMICRGLCACTEMLWMCVLYVYTCDTCSTPPSLQSPTPTRSPAPPNEQISDDSTYNVLQLNANGIGNKLTELGVVLERSKVRVAVIQESKLTPKSKNPLPPELHHGA